MKEAKVIKRMSAQFERLKRIWYESDGGDEYRSWIWNRLGPAETRTFDDAFCPAQNVVRQ